MDRKPNATEQPASYRFGVEVTVQAPNEGVALEQLVRAIKTGRFANFRILSCTRTDPGARPTPGAPSHRPAAAKPRTPAAVPTGSVAPAGGELESRIQAYIDSNRLIRLHVNKGRGVKLDIPCRILNLDAETRNLSVYHVDEKQVYNIRLNEVDDIIE